MRRRDRRRHPDDWQPSVQIEQQGGRHTDRADLDIAAAIAGHLRALNEQ
jgi:hypothetical protein